MWGPVSYSPKLILTVRLTLILSGLVERTLLAEKGVVPWRRTLSRALRFTGEHFGHKVLL